MDESIDQLESNMYERLRALNGKVSTLSGLLQIRLNHHPELVQLSKDAVKALLELTMSMERYSGRVNGLKRRYRNGNR